MKLSGNDYAKVAERIKLFREDFPKGKIETAHVYLSDGSLEFKAWVWKDKTEYLDVLKAVQNLEVARGSADADGSAKAYVKESDKKGFEKLQTIAVGRALAMLGYLGSGDVASFEEMEEFDQYKVNQFQEALEAIKKATKRDEFSAILGKLSPDQKLEATPFINERIAELKKVAEMKKEAEDADTDKS